MKRFLTIIAVVVAMAIARLMLILFVNDVVEAVLLSHGLI